ncbi:MAG: hypothetical protein COA79_13065 [Planctomycetota bacterium]|nr:MAG: hypothetical protein COA79_13065 [Planctomycetota bacterium]
MKKILVIQFQQVGDVLISSELCVAIKKSYPEYVVDYLVASFTRDVVDGHPAINEVIALDKSKGFLHYLSVIRYVRKKKYDIVLDALCKPRTGLIALLSGASNTISFNFKGRGLFYKKLIPLISEGKRHTIDMRMDLVRAAGLEIESSQHAKIHLSEDEKSKFKPILEDRGIKETDFKIIFGVNSRRVYKEWPKDNFLKVISHCIEKYDAKIIFFHTDKERDECVRLQQESEYTSSIYLDWPIESIRNMACLFYQCDFMIGNDSGPRHMAQCLGVPTLSIFSPDISKWSWNPHDDERYVAVDIQDALGLNDEEIIDKLSDVNKENAQEYMNLISPEFVIKKADEMIASLELRNHTL